MVESSCILIETFFDSSIFQLCLLQRTHKAQSHPDLIIMRRKKNQFPNTPNTKWLERYQDWPTTKCAQTVWVCVFGNCVMKLRVPSNNFQSVYKLIFVSSHKVTIGSYIHSCYNSIEQTHSAAFGALDFQKYFTYFSWLLLCFLFFSFFLCLVRALFIFFFFSGGDFILLRLTVRWCVIEQKL